MTRRSATRHTDTGSQGICLSREREPRKALGLTYRIAILVLRDPNTRAVTCNRFDYPEPSTTGYADPRRSGLRSAHARVQPKSSAGPDGA